MQVVVFSDNAMKHGPTAWFPQMVSVPIHATSGQVMEACFRTPFEPADGKTYYFFPLSFRKPWSCTFRKPVSFVAEDKELYL